MGHLIEKYNEAYFTGKNLEGSKVNYGLGEVYQGNNSSIRDFDKLILDRIDFTGASVLEIGYGRGETIQYLKEHGIKNYVGVDFAETAYKIAHQRINEGDIFLFCEDAIDFLKTSESKISKTINIVLLLDVIEHIPRIELQEILELLKKHLSSKSLIVINTPVYRFDNDVIANGLDIRNHTDSIDQSDFIEETKGMHCNKYSINSLQEFMKQCGYFNLTEYQIYGYEQKNAFFGLCKYGRDLTYYELWNKAFATGYPIKNEYVPDNLEFAYQISNSPKIISLTDGILSGIKFIGLMPAIEHFQNDDAANYFSKHIKKGDVIFDVGCYVGLSALHFSKLVGKNGKIICFEPNKYNLLRIKNNFSLNPTLTGNIELYNIGLSDQNEITKMLLSDDIESGHASASQLVKGGNIAISQAELIKMGFFEDTVQMHTLDTFVKESCLIPNVIKIDIEGAEILFLKGATQTLLNYKPILFMELHNVFAACFVTKFLKELNYEYHIISEEWGNRTQIVAIFNDCEKRYILNKHTINALAQSYSSYKAKLYQENLESYSQTLNVQFTQIKNELTQTKDELSQNKNELAQTKNELAQTKNELAQTKNELAQTKNELHRYKNNRIVKLFRCIKHSIYIK